MEWRIIGMDKRFIGMGEVDYRMEKRFIGVEKRKVPASVKGGGTSDWLRLEAEAVGPWLVELSLRGY